MQDHLTKFIRQQEVILEQKKKIDEEFEKAELNRINGYLSTEKILQEAYSDLLKLRMAADEQLEEMIIKKNELDKRSLSLEDKERYREELIKVQENKRKVYKSTAKNLRTINNKIKEIRDSIDLNFSRAKEIRNKFYKRISSKP